MNNMARVQTRSIASRRNPWRSGATMILLGLWTLFILYGTLIPFDFSASGEQVAVKWQALWQNPIHPGPIFDLVANVLLFVPWGGLLAILLGNRRLGLIVTMALATILGGTLSSSVELLQLLEPIRYPSFIDVFTNSAGSALGAFGGWIGCQLVWPWFAPRLRNAVVQGPMTALAVGMTVAILVAAVSPFDLCLGQRPIKEAIKQARIIPFGPAIRASRPPDDPWSWAREALAWSLAGGIFTLALRESGRDVGQSIFGGMAIGVTLAGTCEMAQVFISSRRTDATSILFAAIGCAVGATCAALGRRRHPRAWLVPAQVAWVTVMILTQWSPPGFVPQNLSDIKLNMLIPFMAYYQWSDLRALGDIVDEVLLAVPLGAFLALQWPSGRATIFHAALIGFGVGFLLELGQVFNPARYADITDTFWAATGSALGFMLWRWGCSIRAMVQLA